MHRSVEQTFPGRTVSRPWEQRVAVDKMQQRHRLAAQAVNNMPIVHHLDAAAIAGRTTTWQAQHQALTDEAFQTVIVDPQVQPIADQARWHCIDTLRRMKPLLEVTQR